MPSTVMSTSTANIKGVSIEPWAAMIKAPRPLLPPMNSPTTAPTQASTTATRKPAMMWGRPAGIFKRHKVCQGVARSMRNSSSRCASTCCMHVAVFSSRGKKQISPVITTVGKVPKPNHTMKRGASASLGTTWLSTT